MDLEYHGQLYIDNISMDVEEMEQNYMHDIMVPLQEDLKSSVAQSELAAKEMSLSRPQYAVYTELKSFGIRRDHAFFILVTENCITIDEALSFTITNQAGFQTHLYLPDPNNTNICEICSYQQHLHVQNNSDDQQRDQGRVSYALSLIKKIRKSLGSLSPDEERTIYQSGVKRMCQICLESQNENNMLYFDQQNHEICLQCFRKYLTEKIIISEVESVKCPHCMVELSEKVIENHTSSGMYKKYKIFQRYNAIIKNPYQRFCVTPDCKGVIQLNSRDQSVGLCNICFTTICAKCNRLAHPQISCSMAQDKEMVQLMESRDIQRCTICKTLVQKAEGCNHMTCSVCHYQWCWLCGSMYSQYHMNPLNPLGCPFFARGSFNPSNTPLWKIYLVRVFIFIALLAIIPIALVFSGPCIAAGMYFKAVMENRINRASMPWYIIVIILIGWCIAFISGLILDPIIAVLAIPFGIYFIFEYFRERDRALSRANQNLQAVFGRI